MKATVEILDAEFDKLIKQKLNEKLNEAALDSLIEAKISHKVSEIIKKNLSPEKIDNFARDRISRIITSESLKDYTFGINESDVLSNLESKILLMISNSKDFKHLVKNTLKQSL